MTLLILLFILYDKRIKNIAEGNIESKKIVEILKNEYMSDNAQKEKIVYANDIVNKVEDKNLANKIRKEYSKGYFIISKDQISYYNEDYNEILYDNSIHNRPVLLNNCIPIKIEGNNYVKTSLTDWYDYENNEFAYIAFGDFNNVNFSDNKIINPILVENIFVWIPSFYYDEQNSKMSYKTFNKTNKNHHFKNITSEYLPFSFYYKNRYSHGIWVQIDNNKLSSQIKSRSDIDIHQITSEDKYIIDIFSENYDTNIFNNIRINNYVINMGKGAFFNAEY